MKSRRAFLVPAGFAFIAVAAPLAAQSPYGRPPLLNGVGIEQRLGAQVPRDLAFTDDSGNNIHFGDYMGRKPVILALVYYRCPSLCSLVLNGIVRSTKYQTMSAGKDFEVVAVSIDPRETPAVASQKKREYLSAYGRPESAGGWHFLTGAETASRSLADAVGFHYNYDQKTDQYAHPSGIIVLTPGGRISRYFYGIEYAARDVKLGLVEASGGRIGSPVDQVTLFCFHYDPVSGKYTLAILNILKAAGILTVLALAGIVAYFRLRESRKGEFALHSGEHR
jgi:protein SCO1/2